MPKPLEEETSVEVLHQMVKDLRKENANRRGAHSVYEEAFAGLSQAERNGLLQVVRVYAGDNKAGAELFRGLADRIAPVTQPPEENDVADPVIQPTQTTPQAPEGDPTAQLMAVIEALTAKVESLESVQQERATVEEQENAQRVTQIVQGEFGIQPGTPEWDNFFQVATSELAGGDLDRAKQVYEAIYSPVPGPEGGGAQAGEAGAETNGAVAPEAVTEDAPKFPVTGAKTSTGGPLGGKAVAEEPLDFSDEAVRERATAYLEALNSEPAVQ